jgi:hypothetical protein
MEDNTAFVSTSEKEGWRKLHNEELYSSYSSPKIIRVIKSKSMRWSRHVAHIGKMKVYTKS